MHSVAEQTKKTFKKLNYKFILKKSNKNHSTTHTVIYKWFLGISVQSSYEYTILKTEKKEISQSLYSLYSIDIELITQ